MHRIYYSLSNKLFCAKKQFTKVNHNLSSRQLVTVVKCCNVKVKVRAIKKRLRWQVSRPQGAQTWITQFNLQTTPCLPLAFVRIHQMAPPRTVVTTYIIAAYYSFIDPKKNERLSWPSWLTYSRRFTHISGHPSAAGRAQDSESSPVRDRRSTTAPWNQLWLWLSKHCHHLGKCTILF